jgi:L-ascorbate metabolism protein UlaG (beta-lactamase superfamily)
VGVAQNPSPSDTFPASGGDLRITPIYHATLMLQADGKVIFVDPVTRTFKAEVKTDLSGFPKADLILITDVHGDHMERAGIDQVKKASTIVVAPPSVVSTITESQSISNGETKTIGGFSIEAIPMYNMVRGPEPGKFFHEKGRGNGYVLTAGGKRLYFSGDTECIPEMKALKNIDIAFICMFDRPTMSPAEAAECAKAFRPKVVYPYHFGESNVQQFVDAMRGTPGVEVRVRKWY